MARSRQIKTGFLSGEISPRAYARIDTEMYGSACRLIDNFIVTPQGGALFRQGTKLINTMVHDDAVAPRIIPIRLGGVDDDLVMSLELVTGNPRVMLWDSTGRKYNYGDLPDHVFTAAEFPNLYYTQRGKLLIITSGIRPIQRFIFDDNFRLVLVEDILNTRLPEQKFKDLKSPVDVNSDWEIDFAGLTAFTDRFTVGVNNGPLGQEFLYTGIGDQESIDTTTSALIIGLKAAFGITNNFGVFTVVYKSGEVWTVSFIPPYEDTVWRSIGVGTAPDPQVSIVSPPNSTGELAWSNPTVVFEAAQYYQAVQPSLGVGPTGNPAFWLLYNGTGEKPVWWDYQYPQGNTWDVAIAYGMGDRGFPEVCTFHDQRLVVAATKDAPTTMWGSRISFFEEFNAGINDDQPWSFGLESPNSPAIRWITSQRGLMVGTTDGDWVINGETTITPTNVQATRSTGRKSLNERPVVLGSEVFYIDQSSSKLRHTYYEESSKGLRNEDITLFAEHLGRKGLFRLAYMSVPETVIFAVTQDNDMLSMSYDRFAGVAAWNRLTFPNIEQLGDIVSGFGRERNQILARGTDVIFMAIKRNGGWLLEFLPYPELTDNEGLIYSDTVHLDQYVEEDFAGATSGVIGSSTFNNQQVSVMAQTQAGVQGYAYLGEFTVDGVGNLDIGVPVWGLQIGYKFVGNIETVDVSAGPQGVALGLKRRWDELWIQLFKSMPPLYRQSSTGEWQRAAAKYDQIPQDNPPELFTGEIKMHATGYEAGRVQIRQDLPYPCQVTGLFGRVSTNES